MGLVQHQATGQSPHRVIKFGPVLLSGSWAGHHRNFASSFGHIWQKEKLPSIQIKTNGKGKEQDEKQT